MILLRLMTQVETLLLILNHLRALYVSLNQSDRNVYSYLTFQSKDSKTRFRREMNSILLS